jgi:hypothetical protein
MAIAIDGQPRIRRLENAGAAVPEEDHHAACMWAAAG